MFIIVNNKPYAVKDGKAYVVGFGDKGAVEIRDVVDDINVEDFNKYSYDEIKRKFNLKAMLNKKNEPSQELVDELNKQINILTKENEQLKKKIEDLECSVSEEQVQAVASAIVTEAEEQEKTVEEIVEDIVTEEELEENVEEVKKNKKNK